MSIGRAQALARRQRLQQLTASSSEMGGWLLVFEDRRAAGFGCLAPAAAIYTHFEFAFPPGRQFAKVWGGPSAYPFIAASILFTYVEEPGRRILMAVPRRLRAFAEKLGKSSPAACAAEPGARQIVNGVIAPLRRIAETQAT